MLVPPILPHINTIEVTLFKDMKDGGEIIRRRILGKGPIDTPLEARQALGLFPSNAGDCYFLADGSNSYTVDRLQQMVRGNPPCTEEDLSAALDKAELWMAELTDARTHLLKLPELYSSDVSVLEFTALLQRLKPWLKGSLPLHDASLLSRLNQIRKPLLEAAIVKISGELADVQDLFVRSDESIYRSRLPKVLILREAYRRLLDYGIQGVMVTLRLEDRRSGYWYDAVELLDAQLSSLLKRNFSQP